MDTSVRSIRFDQSGVCQFCRIHDDLESAYPLGTEGEEPLSRITERIRKGGEGKPYDCICGVSGGRDSSYLLYYAKEKLGLRPLAVHFDNGWNSEIATRNISRVCAALDVDLETVVADWNDFRDLQLAFLRASVPDVDIPTDVAIHSVLHEVAAREGIRYVLNGHAFRTEGIAPLDWTYFDGRYLNSVYRTFGTGQVSDYRTFRIKDLIRYQVFRRIEVIPLLNYIEYHKTNVAEFLSPLGWEDYGGHHHENAYTKFIQSYLLPRKFNIDRRRTELSAAVRSQQKARVNALEILRSPYAFDEELIGYALRKLGLESSEFERILREEPKTFRDFQSYYGIIRFFWAPIRLGARFGLLPPLLAAKFDA